MNKKVSLGLTIALIIVSVTATFAITMSVSQRMYNRLVTDLPERMQMYSAVAEVDDIVRSNYFGEFDESALNSSLENGYIYGLNDPYSYYMNADEYGVYAARLDGRNAGIGVDVQLNEATGYLSVTQVYPNSPAQTEGLQKGDEIVEVEGETVTRDNYEQMADRLNGMKLSSVKLTYRRDSTDRQASIIQGYSNRSVSYELMGSIGYIKISAFYKTTRTQLEQAIDSVREGGAQSLIFDVRSCSQGHIDYVCQTIDYLVPVAAQGNKAIATLTDKNGGTVRTYSSDAADITMPMAVLINSQTSGCAELFACDMRDFGKAFLIGDTSAGNAGVQEIFTLSDGGAVVLTTSKVLPYISESYDGVGVVPDTVVMLTAEQEENLSILDTADDAQLQAAISMLSDNSQEQ